MRHHGSPVAGLLAILAALLLAPGALAGTATGKAAGVTTADQRAYAKHCTTKKGRAMERTLCLKAMAKLDKGRTSSPSRACKRLSRKKAKGERRSAYARCVSEGAKLLQAKRRAAAQDADAAYGDGPGEPEGDEGEAPAPIDDSPGVDDEDAGAPSSGDELAPEGEDEPNA